MEIGVQFYTLRNFCKDLAGLEESLKRVSEMGIRIVQLSGVCAYEADWMAERLKKYGLRAPVTHNSLEKIVGETDSLIALHKTIGAEYLGLGMLPDLRNNCNIDYIREKFETLKPAIDKISASGLKFAYHNHDTEFARTEEGKLFLDCIADQIPADKMDFILCTYWVAAGGGDPVQYIEKYGHRIHCLHLKDMKYDGPDKKVHFAPVGEGNMNYSAIFAAAEKAGIPYAFIEQDNCYDEDPFDCLARSKANIEKILLQ